ncbi:MAG TPA: DUF6182 family protein [Pseudonocardiaceae bacterium]
MLNQELLYDQARARLLAARPGFEVPAGPDGMAALLSGTKRVDRDHTDNHADNHDDGHADHHVIAVLHRFDAIAWIRGTCAFVFDIDAERAAAWQKSFTRTIFLAGNPDNLTERVTFDHVAHDSSAAWLGPAPAQTTIGLRRLLKLVDGSAPLPTLPPTTIRLDGPGRGRHRDLYLATVGVAAPAALVHLNHVLAEAALDGLIAPGDVLTLRMVPRLSGVSESFAALRVDVDPTRPDRLQALAGLTKETPGA